MTNFVHPNRIIHDRGKPLERLYAAVASELGIPVRDGVIDPISRWKAVDTAEARYDEWCRLSQQETKPVMRTPVEIAMSNLYNIDYQ